MKPRTSIIVLVFALVITLPIAWTLGFMRGNAVHISKEQAHIKAQVDYLRGLWREPLTLQELQQVRAYEADPEALRALLLSWLPKLYGPPPSGHDPRNPTAINPDFRNQEAARLREKELRARLESWKPGQAEATSK